MRQVTHSRSDVHTITSPHDAAGHSWLRVPRYFSSHSDGFLGFSAPYPLEERLMARSIDDLDRQAVAVELDLRHPPEWVGDLGESLRGATTPSPRA